MGLIIERLIQRRKIVERVGGLGMVTAEHLLADRERAPQNGLRVPVCADGLVQASEIVDRIGGIGMLGAERVFIDR